MNRELQSPEHLTIIIEPVNSVSHACDADSFRGWRHVRHKPTFCCAVSRMPGNSRWPTTRSTLLGRLKNPQDDRAWSGFVDLYLPLIYSYSRGRGLQDADARNVVQEVFLQVSRSIHNFEYNPTRGRFRNWLGLIIHQRILRQWQRETSAVRGVGDGMGDTLGAGLPREVESEWQDAFRAHLYRAARERIRTGFDDDTWQAWQLTWEQGRSPQEAAEQLRKPPHWVYQAKFRVLQQLKAQVVYLSSDDLLTAT
jgi:RNA polymerase sigma factor (sigma-70 family)